MAYEGNVVELKGDILNNNGSINEELLIILLEDPYFDMLKSIIKSDNYKVFFSANGTTLELTISSFVIRFFGLKMMFLSFAIML